MSTCIAGLCACGPVDDTVEVSRGSVAAGAGKPGGELRLIQEAPLSLDPLEVDSVYESVPVNQIFDGLVALDPSLNVRPALASTWTISRNGTVYLFTVRPGVRFHDGSLLSADDVVYTFERNLATERGRRSLVFSYLSVIAGAEDFAAGRLAELPGVRAVDARTVRIELDRPYPSFLQVLAMDGLRIVPRAVVEQLGPQRFARSPVGTGPFRATEWTEQRLLLEANPDYFAGRPFLDHVRLVFLDPREHDLGAARFDREQLDVFVPAADDIQRLTHDPDVHVYRYQELSLSFLGLLCDGVLEDERVRQAVLRAIDREALTAASNGTRRNAVGILPPGMPAFSPQDKVPAHDPDAARRLLAEAGFPSGIPLRIFTTARGPSGRQTRKSIDSDLKAVGIEVEWVEVGWPELNRAVDSHSAPAFLLGWVADLADPDAFLRSLFEHQGSANYFDFYDPQARDLLERGAREMNPIARARIYRQAERRILELAPLVPLYHTVGVVASRRYVRGFEPGPLGLASVDLERVRLVGGGSR